MTRENSRVLHRAKLRFRDILRRKYPDGNWMTPVEDKDSPVPTAAGSAHPDVTGQRVLSQYIARPCGPDLLVRSSCSPNR